MVHVLLADLDIAASAPIRQIRMRGPGRGRGRLSSKGRAAHGGEPQDAAMAAPAERSSSEERER